MLQTPNPELLLLYSFFAPHVRRLLWTFFRFKQDSHLDNLDTTTSSAGLKSTKSTSVSKSSDAFEPYFRQIQVPLNATTSEKRKLDISGKRKKLREPKIAGKELQ